MKSAEKIESIVKRMAFAAGTEIDRSLRAGIERAMETVRTRSIEPERHSKRVFAPCLMPQLAFAGAGWDTIVFGLSASVGREPSSDVPRSEARQKSELSRGVILRSIETVSPTPGCADYAIKYVSPRHSRTDSYKEGQIVRSYYVNLETMTHTLVVHEHKHYLPGQMTGDEEGFLERNEDWLNPSYLLERIQSADHRELGIKTVDGVACEGIETTDPAALGRLPSEITRLELEMRLWINAKTRYPVRFEGKVDCEAEDKRMSSEGALDQFQWDVELDPSVFELDLTGYEDIRNL